MDFKQLEAFVCVVQTGSFSKAAEKLYVTQPTVSAHIGALEKEMDTQLLVRMPKGACPTQTGGILYEHALRILAARDDALLACKKSMPEIGGAIHLAASTIPYRYILPRAMTGFRTLHPDVTFNLQELDSAGVVEQVIAGKAELGMTGAQMEDGKCVYEPFLEDRLVLITPHTPAYERENGFSLNELSALPFIMREPGSGTRKETEAYFAKHGVSIDKLQIVAQMAEQDAIKNAVGQGLGVSIMSELAVKDFEQFGMIRVYPLQEGEASRKLYLVYRKNRPLTCTASEFMRYIRETLYR